MTRKIVINGDEVPVTAEQPTINVDQILNSKLFQDWKNSVDKNIKIDSILIQHADIPGRILFIKFKCIAYLKGETKHPIPGIIILRGGAITCLIELICEGKTYALLVQQPRLPIGQSGYVEAVAGMIDGDSNIKGAGLREIEEETGLKLSSNDLIDLTALAQGPASPGYLSSPGLIDEFIHVYLYRGQVTKEKLAQLQGKLTGERNHGEYITLKVTPLDSLWKEVTDAKILVALYLREKLLQANALPPPRELK